MVVRCVYVYGKQCIIFQRSLSLLMDLCLGTVVFTVVFFSGIAFSPPLSSTPFLGCSVLICVNSISHQPPQMKYKAIEAWSGKNFPSPVPAWHKILELCSGQVLILGEKASHMEKDLHVFPSGYSSPVPTMATGRSFSTPHDETWSSSWRESPQKCRAPQGHPPRSFWVSYQSSFSFQQLIKLTISVFLQVYGSSSFFSMQVDFSCVSACTCLFTFQGDGLSCDLSSLMCRTSH